MEIKKNVRLYKSQTGFGRWRWVHVRKCRCGKEHHIIGNDTKRAPLLPPGAIMCECGEKVYL
jgi:hypothetical protein